MGTISHENYTFSLGFSRADASSPDTTRDVVLYGAHVPISGRTDSRVAAPYQEKRTLPGTHASVSEFVCVAALGAEAPISVSRFGNITRFPFGPPGRREHRPASERPDSDFHGHRPAVYINQHLLWALMSVASGALTRRSVHPASPVLLTKSGPLGTRIRRPAPIKRNRYGPPPEFPLASTSSGIVHHLSGPDTHALARPLRQADRIGR
ncbi:unnamed protein product [Clavelina lepadiformis]|uniref:Uncharacterized protein n=1 Tax=Clavelina lepadiformis TaxID=159417 RepID=A0ABP0GNT2_CLALP